jgi:hypothetical protein
MSLSPADGVLRAQLYNLHQQILIARDPNLLASLLARYVAAATTGALRGEWTQDRMSKLVLAISGNVAMRQKESYQMVQNIKA